MKEVWRDVVGYEKYFMVSNFGEVWSKRTNIILVPTVTKAGYNTIATRFFGRWGGAKTIRIHRMVAEAFIPNLENKPLVNHLDGNKRNNNYKNLEWCTYSENSIHAIKNGLQKVFKGEDSSQSKLTMKQVIKIRKDFQKNKETHRVIAERWGLDRSSITDILNNKTYVE